MSLDKQLQDLCCDGVPVEEVLEMRDCEVIAWFTKDFPHITAEAKAIKAWAAEWNEETRSPYSDAERLQDRLTYANESASTCGSWNDHY